MGNKSKKFIFVTGGVASSLGKGLASASIASLLERRGIKINMLKIDPYLNIDPGTMGPTQHGEVFVTDDGAETDLDLGHYERFTNLTLGRQSNFTTGQVYMQVIERERQGDYLGKTVQVIPHITDEIKRRIHLAAEGSDLLLAEIGGTVGDIESQPYLEAIRQFAHDVGPNNVLFIHLVLIPYIKVAGELKSKPAQHSVRELRHSGLFPNIIICRSGREIDDSTMEKLSLFCNVPTNCIFSSIDLDSIYKLPINLNRQGLDDKIVESLGMWTARPDISDLEQVVDNFDNPVGTVNIGVVGKYTELAESYKSLEEALVHGANANKLRLNLTYLDAEEFEHHQLDQIGGILVPGGFGERGTEQKISAIKYARENGIPFLGICLGMQLAVIEFARNQAGITGAISREFGDQGELVIDYMEGQGSDHAKGGTMRLGAYDCQIKKQTLASKVYETGHISERHRHRLEVNNAFIPQLEKHGLVVSGTNPQLNLVEIIELGDHPWFVGCQYHPEFKSRPFAPHPLFSSFVAAAAGESS